MLYPSKGAPGIGQITALRQLEVERSVAELIQSVSESEILGRIQTIDDAITTVRATPVILAKLLRDPGPLGNNVFGFFPGLLGVKSAAPDDHFAIEFLDVWHMEVNDVIAPFVTTIFTDDAAETLLAVAETDVIIGLSSFAHELGHHATPFKVIPRRHDALIGINPFLFDAAGELLADVVGGVVLREFPAIVTWGWLWRLARYTRRNFIANPGEAALNDDNDALVGGYFFGRLSSAKAITRDGVRLTYDQEAAAIVWSSIVSDWIAIANDLVHLNPADQDKAIISEFSRFVPRVDGRFKLTRLRVETFSRSVAVPVLGRSPSRIAA